MITEQDSNHLAGMLIVHKQELLVLERLKGGYDIPKGHIQIGEKPLDAAIRECWEETKIHLNTEPRFIGSQTESGQSLYCYLHLTNKRYEIAVSNEHIGYEWMPISEVPEVHPLVNHFIEKLNKIMEK